MADYKLLDGDNNVIKKVSISDEDVNNYIGLEIAGITITSVEEIVTELSNEELSNKNRNIRDSLLQETDWIISRYKEQQDNISIDSSEDTSDKYQEWLNYRQDLRDISQQDSWPTDITWPTKPT
jgi:hypothetical protein